jgi:hypothetical protein
VGTRLLFELSKPAGGLPERLVAGGELAGGSATLCGVRGGLNL